MDWIGCWIGLPLSLSDGLPPLAVAGYAISW
ncbi:hypothetical protein A2U01_0119228, partial [Trifolium medium]|nr:hypothetical protein [Trifolium medium]